jgi:nitronate monooxygenase
MGADFAYMGTRFIASQEAHAAQMYKEAIVNAKSADIIYTDYFTGIHGNYIQESILKAGLDPKNLPLKQDDAMQNLLAEKSNQAIKPWKDIWGAGQGVGSIQDISKVAEIVSRIEKEYQLAFKKICS